MVSKIKSCCTSTLQRLLSHTFAAKIRGQGTGRVCFVCFDPSRHKLSFIVSKAIPKVNSQLTLLSLVNLFYSSNRCILCSLPLLGRALLWPYNPSNGVLYYRNRFQFLNVSNLIIWFPSRPVSMLFNQSRRIQCRRPFTHLTGVGNTWPSHTERRRDLNQELVPSTFGEGFIEEWLVWLIGCLFQPFICFTSRCEGVAEYSCCFMNISWMEGDS